MNPATHDHAIRTDAEPVWFGMEIATCAEGCGASVARAGEVCADCRAERREVRGLIATLLDAGIPVSREAVGV